MKHIDFLQIAIDEALMGMRQNEGGPFGAVVVSDGRIIGKAHNRVTSLIDPTAHAEILAIREACKTNNSYHLEEASIYTTCEPCPMCLSAIYWAKISKVYFCSDRHDASDMGFNDQYIYEELSLPPGKRTLQQERINLIQSEQLMQEWIAKSDKKTY